jgi:pimeloyl-ACP methyl ester carboxylesterase
MSSVTERTLQANGLAFNLAEAGDGPPVLLLHGFPDSWRLWRHQIPALAEAGHRMIAPDLRGFGQTDRPAGVEHYKLRALVRDVVGLLDGLDVERAAVVGHDWGAALAWAVARFVPDRVSRLVVVSVGHPLASAAAGLANGSCPGTCCGSCFLAWPSGSCARTTGRSSAAGPGAGPDPARILTSTGSSPTCPARVRWWRG